MPLRPGNSTIVVPAYAYYFVHVIYCIYITYYVTHYIIYIFCRYIYYVLSSPVRFVCVRESMFVCVCVCVCVYYGNPTMSYNLHPRARHRQGGPVARGCPAHRPPPPGPSAPSVEMRLYVCVYVIEHPCSLSHLWPCVRACIVRV